MNYIRYKHGENIIKELWRVADNPAESVRWSNEMKSDIIFSCYEIIKSTDNFQEALSKFNNEVLPVPVPPETNTDAPFSTANHR